MGEATFTPLSSSSAPHQPSYPTPQQISANLTLQAPLSRRGRGPGLILVLDHYALIQKSEKHLDPPPLQKWAEEGFCVAQLLVPGKVEDGGEFPLQKALDVLKSCEGCEFSNGVGLISYISRVPYYVEEAAFLSPDIKALVSYGGRKFTTLNESAIATPPQLIHTAGTDLPRRESCSIVPDASAQLPPSGTIKSYRYVDAKKDSNWTLPSDEEYHKQSAGIAHTRSLTFLKPLLDGPFFDLEAVWEEHCKYEFVERDVEKTMATMVDEPYVNHIPTMTGGVGKERLTAFYTHHFIFSNPPDTSLSLVSRTVGIDRVIDEFVFSLTHTTLVPWLLPGIPPTGKKLELPFTSIVAMRGDRLCHEHISWDQATALQQLGLLPEYVRFPYEIEGTAAPQGKKFEVPLPAAGVETSRKLVDEGSEESNRLLDKGWRVVDDD
ncbi:NTF2-like protein [Cucurbitaria berberidis CBS 394.84]|uniref:NTF2-like protein n=1 Tax=Cucurbitaria berberidis CBS 394.84 TaxID=1168544 RepID=A0A9P4G7H5_9PLEO|nr:NTF2-like protein [Cucurbitaria berberidis CBS 394.84]KAF1840468.1 NTF2-like protein [Cucurbitaria berberidis CBS 394.84]